MSPLFLTMQKLEERKCLSLSFDFHSHSKVSHWLNVTGGHLARESGKKWFIFLALSGKGKKLDGLIRGTENGVLGTIWHSPSQQHVFMPTNLPSFQLSIQLPSKYQVPTQKAVNTYKYEYILIPSFPHYAKQ